MITEEDLKEIEERSNKATNPNWLVLDESTIITDSMHQAFGSGRIIVTRYKEDAQFAHSRQDIPDLITEIRKLREALEDVVTLMSGAPAVAPLTDTVVLERAERALGIEK